MNATDANKPKHKNVDETPIIWLNDPAIHDPMAIPEKIFHCLEE